MSKAGLRFNANYPQGTMTITPLRDDAPGESFDLPIGDISNCSGRLWASPRRPMT